MEEEAVAAPDVLAWRIHGQRALQAIVHGNARVTHD